MHVVLNQQKKKEAKTEKTDGKTEEGGKTEASDICKSKDKLLKVVQPSAI